MKIGPRFSKIVSCLIIVLLTGTTLAAARSDSEPTIALTISEPQYSYTATSLNDGSFAMVTASNTQDYTTAVGAPKLPVR